MERWDNGTSLAANEQLVWTVVAQVREVYWSTVRDGRVVDWWGLEDDDERRSQLRPSRRGAARPGSGRP
ncbi:MAG: hypothetical protein ACLGI3_03110 [Actinomycetes bacterium]